MKLLCHSISGSRYGRRFCFVNFKPKSGKKSRQVGSGSRSSLDQYEKSKTREPPKQKLKKSQKRKARFPSITHTTCYPRFNQYDRVSSTSSSSGLSTDSVSSDSDSDDLDAIHHRERIAILRSSTHTQQEDIPPLITSTDESNSDFSESDVSSILTVWSSSDSSSSSGEAEREYEFYSDPDSNRQSTDSTNMPVFTDLINSLDLQLSELIPMSIQVLSESLLRNFGDDIGWGPCPGSVVEMLSRRTLSDYDLVDSPACAICCADFKTTEEVIDLPCKHYYHSDCICSWLKIRSTCPACRSNVCNLADLPETEV